MNDTASRKARIAKYKRKVLKAALMYAAKGIPVFPCMLIKGQKKPLVKFGKGEDGHPQLYRRRATTDPNTIRAWWRKWPLAMIGMPTGHRSGFVVLDIDRKNGVDGLKNLRAKGIDPFSLSRMIVHTPSGGLHFYFRYAGPLKNSTSLLAAGVDVRGDRGFVVVPPSDPTFKGAAYRWERSEHALA